MTYDFTTMSDRARVASAKYKDMFALKKDVPEDIVPFSMADMEFKNAPEIVEAIKEYVDTYPLGYVYATEDYLNALKNWMKTRHDRDIETDWIHPIPGVVCGIDAAILSLTEPGDGIVYCSPVFGLFKMGIEGHGRRALASSVLWDGENWQMDFEDIEKKAADPKTTAMIVCNPHNPLARVWTEEELRRLGDICVKNDLVLISDEIHGDLTMPGYELCSFLNLSEELNERLNALADRVYAKREEAFGLMPDGTPLMRELERVIMLRVVDEYWMDHIDAMDDLRRGIGLRGYGNVKPVDAYKQEGFDMFEAMIAGIRAEVVRRIYTVRVRREENVQRKSVAKNAVTNAPGDGTVKKQPVKKVKKPGRNDPCPCGKLRPNGLPMKYKDCCGRNE